MASRRIAGITIEIGGDTTKLNTALREVDKQISTTASALRDTNKLLKLDPGNTELLVQKQKNLSAEINATKQRLSELKNVSKESMTPEQWDALQREIIETEQKLKGLEKEYQNLSTAAGVALTGAGEKLNDWGAKWEAAGGKVKGVGESLTKNITIPVAGVVGAAVKLAADFDAQMSKVQAISGATGGELQQLREKAEEMGEKTKFSAQESGEAFEYMAMAGWKTNDMLSGIDGILNLAAASGEELGKTSDIVTDALTAFGMSAEESGHFADVLAAASSNANTNVSMLGESFKYVAPVAGAMGYSAEDTSLALGLMANSGIKASSAGTALRTMLTNMANPSETMAGAMRDLGVSLDDGNGKMYSLREIMQNLRSGFGELQMSSEDFDAEMGQLDAELEAGVITQKRYDKEQAELIKKAYGAEGALKAQAAAQLAGKTGLSGLLAIVNASDEDFDKFAGAIDGSSEKMAKLKDGSIVPLSEAMKSGKEVVETYDGAAEAMAKTMQDNLSGDLVELKSKIAGIGITLGETLIPHLRKGAEWLKEMADRFKNLSPETQGAILKAALLAAAIGPLLVAGGSVISGIGKIMSVGGSLLTGGASLIGFITKMAVPAIGELIAAAAPILAAAAPFIALGAAIVGVGVLVYKNWDKIKETAGKMKDAVVEKWNALKDGISTAIDSIKSAVSEKWNAIKSAVDTVINAIKTAVSTAWNAIKAATSTAFNAVKTVASTVWNGIKTAITTVINAIKTGVTTAWNGIKTATSTVFNAVKTVVDTVWNGIKTAVTTAVNAVKTTVTNVWNGIKTTTSTVWNGIKTAVTTVVNGLKSAVTSPLNAVKNTFETVFNGIKIHVNKVVEWLKGIFNFKWELPKIKLPHFKLTGEFSLKKKTVPKLTVEWYKKAYDDPVLFNSPTVLPTASGLKGFGDGNGAEIVMGLNKLRQLVGATGNTTTINVYGAVGQDVNELAEIVSDKINKQVYRNRAVFA